MRRCTPRCATGAILLATDGSEEAQLAASRAVDVAGNTASELRVALVGAVPTFLESYPGTLGHDRKHYEQIEEEFRELLRKESWRLLIAQQRTTTPISVPVRSLS